jgi:hypothetical protein
MDIPCGRYHKGKHGDMILNGGFSNFIGFGGRGNTFKTALALANSLRVLDRYDQSRLTIYDTEITFSIDRIEDMATRFKNLDYIDAVETGRIMLTSAAEHSGNAWWKIVRDQAEERMKDSKKLKKATPFLDMKKEPIKAFQPEIHFLDSMSQLQTDAVEEIYAKHEIDAGAANTDALRGAAIKTRLVMQVPQVTAGGGMTLLATAHVGDEMKLDPYAPAKQQLAFLKKGLKFKNTPEKFTFLTSNCWVVTDASPLINKGTKAPEYPLPGFNDAVGDTDLQELNLINVRSKSGPTGHTFKLIISQTEGLLPSLSEYHYLKERKDKFGLIGPEGVQKSWRLVLYPETLLKRTTVRDVIDDDVRLQRALEFTSELCQIYEYWPDFERKDIVEPQALYDKLIELGYDWNVLLDTRGYWTFDHYENEVPPLSTMDLINMYHERYVPFWYPDKDKLKIKLKDNDGESDGDNSA